MKSTVTCLIRSDASGISLILQQLESPFGRQRPAEIVSLNIIAAMLLQIVHLNLVLHSLGHDLELQFVSQLDDIPGDQNLFPGIGNRAYEGNVDLDAGDIQPHEPGKRGIAGSEIIQGDAEAQAFQLF